MNLNKEYWESVYQNKQHGWDIGYPSTPLKNYIDQLENKSLKILVPGAGNAYEVEYLFEQEFKSVSLIDFAETPIANFKKRIPRFPHSQIFKEDFFTHKEKYNLIIEQTFFASLPRSKRLDYAKKMHNLLVTGGKLSGLLFNHEFNPDHPPFGGTIKEYRKLFSPYFKIKIMENCYNSIKPRQGRELFLVLIKK
ncbi:MAG: SAM-dependent methyltransferase [Bacteroidetes bacterium]|nr:SAM-dependent methyltransferase [Bacteroidota bacterium]